MKATEKQKLAIRNLLSHVRTWNKHRHHCINENENKVIEELSKEKASRQIDKLINDVKAKDEQMSQEYYDMVGEYHWDW